jgi:hypothetical protein
MRGKPRSRVLFDWRIIENGRATISSFDHEQQYGLLAPINAIEMLHDVLAGKEVS